MSLIAIREFLLIAGLGLVVSGLTTYIITWMLVAVHLRDHHKQEHAALGRFLFAPHAMIWYLRARYRVLQDRDLNALAVLGSIGVWSMVIGALVALLSKVLSYL